MPVQCNINPLGFFLNVTRFVIVECKKLKKEKKKLVDLEFLTHKEDNIEKEPLRHVRQK